MVQVVDTRAASNVGTGNPAGFDGGNTDVCLSVFVNGQEKTVVLPSTVIALFDNKLETLRDAVSQTVDGEITPYNQYQSDLIVEYLGKRYLVGYSAMRQSKRASTQKGDDTRYYSVEQIVRLLAASTLAIPYTHYEINLVTTVPFGYYTKSLRQHIKQKLSGVHDFKIGGVERHLIVNVKQVMVEGSPALALYGSASANKRRIVIDGGGHTTELLTFDGKDPVADHCRGVELGVEGIADYVADQVLEQHNRRLTVRDRSDILRAYGSRNSTQPIPYPEISCGTYIVGAQELHALCRVGATQIAEATANEAAQLWGKVNDIVAGDIIHQYHLGGSVHFYNDLLQGGMMPLLMSITGAETANARGCARIAKTLG